MPKHKTDSDGAIKKIKKQDESSKLLKNQNKKSQQRFISNKYDVYTENINKIALSNNDDKKYH